MHVINRHISWDLLPLHMRSVHHLRARQDKTPISLHIRGFFHNCAHITALSMSSSSIRRLSALRGFQSLQYLCRCYTTGFQIHQRKFNQKSKPHLARTDTKFKQKKKPYLVRTDTKFKQKKKSKPYLARTDTIFL